MRHAFHQQHEANALKRCLWTLLILAVGLLCGRLSHELPVSAQECDNEPPRCQDVNGDDGVDIADAIYLLSWLFGGGPEPECPCSCPPAFPCQLPATGQTRCFDTWGNEIPCDSEEWPRQDGFAQPGCLVEGRFVDNHDGTVTDRCTGLMWQQDTATDLYNWQDALQYCAYQVDLPGSNWRLPNYRELDSISLPGPVIHSAFVTEAGSYWSSSSLSMNPSYATTWDPEVGLYAEQKSERFHVRAVRTMEAGEL